MVFSAQNDLPQKSSSLEGWGPHPAPSLRGVPAPPASGCRRGKAHSGVSGTRKASRTRPPRHRSRGCSLSSSWRSLEAQGTRRFPTALPRGRSQAAPGSSRACRHLRCGHPGPAARLSQLRPGASCLLPLVPALASVPSAAVSAGGPAGSHRPQASSTAASVLAAPCGPCGRLVPGSQRAVGGDA